MAPLVQLVCPAPSGSRTGNRITAERWARLLRSLGHRVRLSERYEGENADVLVALHARKSAPAVRAFGKRYPERGLVVALAGTDLYRDLPGSPTARRSLESASRLILLQSAGLARLPRRLRAKARVIRQSAEPARAGRAPAGRFDVCVLGHLRPIKDPLRAAMAVRQLPSDSRIRILQVGAGLDPRLAARARAEELRNPRFRWLGERSHRAARGQLARCHLMVLSSRSEGGANVIGEAAVAGLPILASRIEGSVGLLGPRYPGYFPVGDTRALRALLLRAESDAAFYAQLQTAVRKIAPLFRPARERAAWRSLLRELTAERVP